MLAKRLNPILNVSNIQESFSWFEKLGWTKAWEWGNPPGFAGVCSGDCEIFVPSVRGIRHSPRELTHWDDCARGADILLGAVLEMDRA